MKEHPTHKGYFVTEDGRIFSSYTNRELKSHIDRKGYKRITLRVVNRSIFIHRLVAETYIPNPNNKPEINHKDRNPLNNNLSNLEWVTHKENILHKLVNQNVWTIEYIPTGELWKVTNLLDFCKEHNISYCLHETLTAKRGRTQHKE